MKIISLRIPEVKLITPRRFEDERGYFTESFHQQALYDAGITAPFVQDNHSYSTTIGTVRGLHYQSAPHAQGKLVRVVAGAVLDVVVDVRVGSPTYGEHISAELSAENGTQLWVPTGFLHGFVTLAPNVHLLYKVTDYYSSECDGAVAWNDPDLGIDWGVTNDKAVLSAKDESAGSWANFNSPFIY